jgi:citrate synthase
VRIGKQDNPKSAISTSTADAITVRGRDLCADLIGKVGFTDYFIFLVTGKDPTDDQRAMTDAVLVSIAEHGLVPSIQAARMTYAAAPDAFQGAVAAGLLGCGSVVLGSSESCGRMLAQLVAEAKESGKDAAAVARAHLSALRADRKPIPGFGHPLHSGGDPRALRLLAIAAERGAGGAHVAMLETLEQAIPEIYERTLPINVSGAIPAIMLDVDFPVSALKGVPILARTASLIGHLHEESERPIGFLLSHHADKAIAYDGPPPPARAAE